MKRYKRNLEIGDFAITKRTAQRIKRTRNIDIENSEEVLENSMCKNENTLNRCDSANEDISCARTNIDSLADVSIQEEDELNLNDYLHKLLLQDEIENSDESYRNPQNLQEMVQNEDFFKKITTPVNVTKGELFLSVLKFSIVNNLSTLAITNLFNLFNVIFGSQIMPGSRYLLDKIINPKDDAEFYAVCHNCSAYIGEFSKISSVKSCRICEVELDLKNESNPSYFIIINPSTQIKDLISFYDVFYDYVVKERIPKPDHLEDVYDGKEYRKFVCSLPEEDKHRYVSAVLNTDGAPKFECSQYSIWPIYLILNELPKQERNNKLITCGLWFNKKKPDMSIFLGKFIDVINKLTKEGISCSIKNEERLLKLYIIACCVDSVARAPILGMKQFNGRFGCNWCLHPGVYAERSMRYPLLTTATKFRNHEQTIKDMLRATPKEPINGIKYSSPLMLLSNFNIISGIIVDYLHCCLEGVASQITEYHIRSMSENDVEEIDFKIMSIAAPHQIARLSRPLTCRNDWKAREWENYVLYYSTPILAEHLSRNMLNHWLLFVESLYILLQSSISIPEVNRADEMLHEFVGKCEEIYGIKAMTFNIHQLLHISDTVLNFGPLWCNSTFSFESANHNLLKAIKCSKGVTLQIARFININHIISLVEEYVYPHADDLIKMYCDDILSSKKVRNTYKISEITYFGLGNRVDDDILNQLGLSKSSAKLYCKMIKNRCLYESFSRLKKRSNNSFAQLHDKTFIKIIDFIVDDKDNKELTICNVIHTSIRFTNHYKQLRRIDDIDEVITIVPTKEITTICIFMKILGIMYICPLPNLMHY